MTASSLPGMGGVGQATIPVKRPLRSGELCCASANSMQKTAQKPWQPPLRAKTRTFQLSDGRWKPNQTHRFQNIRVTSKSELQMGSSPDVFGWLCEVGQVSDSAITPQHVDCMLTHIQLTTFSHEYVKIFLVGAWGKTLVGLAGWLKPLPLTMVHGRADRSTLQPGCLPPASATWAMGGGDLWAHNLTVIAWHDMQASNKLLALNLWERVERKHIYQYDCSWAA